ncbi:DUF433 domain-containing protein [Pseudocalidococcus azoricus]|uniref:DUF433 domain-containing protein n=1 Tax=Pseudocalidococcus azoricus TaxID=3110322 RepID=UPI00389AD7DA
MTLGENQDSLIIRTERGLTISGTRITLYDVMDYVIAQYPPKFIQSLFDLTEAQLNAALSYIEANRSEVEAEYRQVPQEAEELRHYYNQKNSEIVSRIASQPPRPGTELAWEKLRSAKIKYTQSMNFLILN